MDLSPATAVLTPIRAASNDGTYLITQHANDQVLLRGLQLADVALAVATDAPEIIEDYPSDPRGASCLVLCQNAEGVAYHVVCSYPPDVWLITVYRPDPAMWSNDFRTRFPT